MAGEGVTSILPKSLDGGHLKDQANLQRTQLRTVALDIFDWDLTRLRKPDDLTASLSTAATGTYLGIVTGTYGSSAPTVQSGDLHSAGLTTRKCRDLISLPNYYVAGGQVSIYVCAGMSGHVADTLATVLVEAYEINDDGTLSANLAGAAQSINNLIPATLNFPLTATGLVPGSRLDVRISMAINDAATGGSVIGELIALYRKCSTNP